MGADGRTVGEGGLAAQVEQCYLDGATALAATGATWLGHPPLPQLRPRVRPGPAASAIAVLRRMLLGRQLASTARCASGDQSWAAIGPGG